MWGRAALFSFLVMILSACSAAIPRSDVGDYRWVVRTSGLERYLTAAGGPGEVVTANGLTEPTATTVYIENVDSPGSSAPRVRFVIAETGHPLIAQGGRLMVGDLSQVNDARSQFVLVGDEEGDNGASLPSAVRIRQAEGSAAWMLDGDEISLMSGQGQLFELITWGRVG